MWHPPERIRHTPLDAQWPDAETASSSRLFSPLDAGRLHLADRTWVPAMVPWRATEEGFVTPEVLSWYERFARGAPAAIVVEATGVRDIPSGPLLRIGDDRFIAGLEDLVRTVRRASGGRTKLFIQIIDFLTVRRRPTRETFLGRHLKITDAHRRAWRAWGSDPVSCANSHQEDTPQVSPLGDFAQETRSDPEVRAWLLALPDERLREVLSPREIEALDFGLRERVTDVRQPHIRDLPKTLPAIFAAAARRAEAAGFDGVELHYAHAYTMASFLSARNTRDDGYGGVRENRVRLPLETFHAVRAAVSNTFPVGCRYLSDECLEGDEGSPKGLRYEDGSSKGLDYEDGSPNESRYETGCGSTVDDAIYFGVEFAKAGMDFLSLSRGGKFEDAKQPKVGWAVYPYTGPSGWECMPTVLADQAGPFGRNVDPASRIRHAIREAGLSTPVVVAGGISTFEQAEEILSSGAADIIAAARQSLADPDWFMKMRLGRGSEIRRCCFTNYCEGLDQMHKQVTCKLWDREALDEPGVPLSIDGKRRLVAPCR